MRVPCTPWGLVLIMFSFITLLSVTNAATFNGAHHYHDKLHQARSVVPAGIGSSPNGEALKPKSSMTGSLHAPKHRFRPSPSKNNPSTTFSKALTKAPHDALAQSKASIQHKARPHIAELKARSAIDDSGCPQTNGTTFMSDANKSYETICGINIAGQDIQFQSVANFTECVAACDATNAQAGENNCLAVIFTPGRINYANDCYLKYATNDATSVDSPVEGAILQVSADTASATAMVSGVTYASGTSVIVPAIAYSQLHGPTQNYPTTQYIHLSLSPDLTIATNLLSVGVESDLSTDYGISPDTGCLQLNSTTNPLLTDLTDTPHLSRDGGKGGVLNGQHIFVFCDTGSYSTTTDNTNGNFLAFVCSSIATDTGMNALYGNPIHLQDGIGEWSDNVGRMRGFAPLTVGEQGYNLVMQGKGQRYAIWPESSIIPLDSQNALMYAPIVYDSVDETTGVATFTYTGATLLTISAGNTAGPSAERTVNRLFEEDEVEWGCVGGIRSWGPSGIGGTDGMLYVFGNVRGGLLLAKVAPTSIANRNSYQYWTGNSWSHGMQAPTSAAYFISGSFMDVDVFYSPRHLTFIIVYMTIYADSTFYYRYLIADQGILPPFAPGGDSSIDYVAYILQYNWSDEIPLYKTGTGLNGAYTYAGGVHQGYFGVDDIINGGSKMLLSWTAPTGLNPATETSEYQIVTAEIDWV